METEEPRTIDQCDTPTMLQAIADLLADHDLVTANGVIRVREVSVDEIDRAVEIELFGGQSFYLEISETH